MKSTISPAMNSNDFIGHMHWASKHSPYIFHLQHWNDKDKKRRRKNSSNEEIKNEANSANILA